MGLSSPDFDFSVLEAYGDDDIAFEFLSVSENEFKNQQIKHHTSEFLKSNYKQKSEYRNNKKHSDDHFFVTVGEIRKMARQLLAEDGYVGLINLYIEAERMFLENNQLRNNDNFQEEYSNLSEKIKSYTSRFFQSFPAGPASYRLHNVENSVARYSMFLIGEKK